jgi:hypothetical protein
VRVEIVQDFLEFLAGVGMDGVGLQFKDVRFQEDSVEFEIDSASYFVLLEGILIEDCERFDLGLVGQ